MKLLGFNYTKITAEKQKSRKADKVQQALIFSEVEKEEIPSMKDVGVLRFSFKHTITYEKDYASVDLEGTVLLQLEDELIKSTLKEWKKSKELINEVKIPLYRILLNKCGLYSLNLEENLGIPPHMNLVNVKKS